MPHGLVLALCPSCEYWQPDDSALTGRLCILKVGGAPTRSLCDSYLRAPGRGDAHEWVEPESSRVDQG